jgi:putative acetyltransferase
VAATIAIESPLQDEVRVLVKALNAYLNPLSPPQFQFQMTVEQMADDDTTVFIARDGEGRPVGIGALKVFDADLAEVKRMYTLPEVRGQRVGVALLQAIEALAR